MTRLKVTESGWYKLGFAVIQWAVIAAAGWVVLTAQAVSNNAKMGKKAYEIVQKVDSKADSLRSECVRIQSDQAVINTSVAKDVEYMKRDVSEIKRMVEQLYINLLEK